MPDLDTVLTVVLAGLVLSATPGPSMLYVLSRSVGQSRKAGYASALGLGIGGLLLAVATALGLAALFATFDWIEVVLRYAGSAYLVWLGVDMILDARSQTDTELELRTVRERSFRDIMVQGIWIELLNPKTVLFFALFIPPFVDRTADANVWLHLLLLGAIVPLTAIPSDLLVAWMGSSIAKRLARETTMGTMLAWLGGGTLILIALNLHLGVI